jgi:hypothetical protein
MRLQRQAAMDAAEHIKAAEDKAFQSRMAALEKQDAAKRVKGAAAHRAAAWEQNEETRLKRQSTTVAATKTLT